MISSSHTVSSSPPLILRPPNTRRLQDQITLPSLCTPLSFVLATPSGLEVFGPSFRSDVISVRRLDSASTSILLMVPGVRPGLVFTVGQGSIIAPGLLRPRAATTIQGQHDELCILSEPFSEKVVSDKRASPTLTPKVPTATNNSNPA